MNKVIVVGADHHNTLGMVRSLGIKGIKPDVYLVKDKNTKITTVKSKYINTNKIFASDQDVIDYLKSQSIVDTIDKPVILLGSDSAVACIDANYINLKDKYYFFNAQGKLPALMNKETMCKLAVEENLNVPQHIVYRKGDTIPQDLDFPCITKAISSIDGDKSDTTICQNRDELELFLATPGLCHSIQIEQFIDKEIEFQFIGLSLNGGEIIIIPGHSHIDRPNGIQNTYYFEYKENDDSFKETLLKTKKYIKRTGYSGIFSVEFLRGKDGIDYFLEMNFRNDGNAICVTDAGYNLAYIWYLYTTGQDYKREISSSQFKPVNYCPELYYTMQYAYGEVSLFRYLKDLFRANSFTNYFKGDSPWYYWPKFSIYIIFWSWRKIQFKLGIKQPPKESIG